MRWSTKRLIVLIFIGLSAFSLNAQGLVRVDNLSTNSGVLNYYNDLMRQDFNLQLLGGVNFSSLQIIHTWLIRDGSAIGISVAPGRFADPRATSYIIPGVQAGDLAYIQLLAWAGEFTNYNDSFTAGAPGGQVTFYNPTGNSASVPDLVKMPTWGIAALETPPVVYARLKIQSAGQQVTISWPLGTLVSAPTLAGPYSAVAGASSPFVITSAVASATFYRLRQ